VSYGDVLYGIPILIHSPMITSDKIIIHFMKTRFQVFLGIWVNPYISGMGLPRIFGWVGTPYIDEQAEYRISFL